MHLAGRTKLKDCHSKATGTFRQHFTVCKELMRDPQDPLLIKLFVCTTHLFNEPTFSCCFRLVQLRSVSCPLTYVTAIVRKPALNIS